MSALGPRLRTYLIPTLLGLLAGIVVLSASWPTLGSAWHTGTYWGSVAVETWARAVWAGALIAGIAICAWLRAWRQLPFLIPIVMIAALPPDRLDMSRDLLERRLALEANAVNQSSSETLFVAFNIAYNNALRFAFLFELGERSEAIPDNIPGVRTFVAHRDISKVVARLTSLDRQDFLSLDRVTLLRVQEDRNDLIATSGTRSVSDCRREFYALNPAEISSQFGLNRTEINQRISALRDCVQTSASIQRARERIEALNGLIEQTRLGEENIAVLADLISVSNTLDDAMAQQRQASGTLIVASAIALAAVVCTLTLSGGWIVAPVMVLVTAVALTAEQMTLGEPPPFQWQIAASAIAATAVLLTTRMVRLYAVSNAYLWTQVLASERLPLLVRAARQSWPPALVLALAIGLGAWFDAQLLNPAYAGAEAGAEAECQDADNRLLATGQNGDMPDGCQPRRPEQDVEEAVVRHIGQFRNDMLAGTETLSAETMEGADWAENEANRLFDDNIPGRLSRREAPGKGEHVSPVFDKRSCKFWEIGCLATNLGKGYAQGSYRKGRANAETALANRLRTAGDALKEGTDLAKTEVDAAAEAALAQIEADVDRALWVGFRTGDVMRHIAILFLAISVLKCLGYVYLRNVHHIPGFRERLPNVVGDGAPSPAPRVEHSQEGSNLTIQPQEEMRVVGSVGVADLPSVWSWPVMNLNFLLRHTLPSIIKLDWSNTTFNHFKNVPGEPFTIEGRKDSRLCAVHLAKGEIAAFLPKALIGYSKGVQVRSRWSFGAIDLLSARVRIPVLVGPGVVILCLRGELDMADMAAGADRFVRKSSLVLWTPEAPYAVKGEVGTKATYGGSVNVQPVAGGFAIGDRGLAGGGGIGLGLVLALAVPV